MAAGSDKICRTSKHPPAEPEAFRLLAPQRGLIATAQDASPRAKLGTVRSLRRVRQVALSSHWRAMRANPRFPELSNFYCLPGRAGGSLIGLGLPGIAGATGTECRHQEKLY